MKAKPKPVVRPAEVSFLARSFMRIFGAELERAIAEGRMPGFKPHPTAVPPAPTLRKEKRHG